MNPLRHPDLRLRFLPGHRQVLECADTEIEVSDEVLRVIRLCDGTATEEEVAERLSWDGLRLPLRRALVARIVGELRSNGIILAEPAAATPTDDYFRSYGRPDVHRLFVSDATRTDKYRAAIRELVRPGDVVIDLGTGTGILAHLAVQAGASVVHAIEPAPIIDAARRVAQANGISNIQFHSGSAASFRLPVRADVLLCDWVGRLVVLERIFPALADLRDRALKPDGRLFPGRIDLQLAPVCDARLRADGPEFWARSPYDVDFSLLREIEYDGLEVEVCTIRPEALLADPQTVQSFDPHVLSPDDLWKFTSSAAEFVVGTDTVLDGFCGSFTAELSPSVRLDTGPLAAPTFYQQVFLRTRPLQLRVGDRVRAKLVVGQRISIKGQVEGETTRSFEFHYGWS